MSWFPFLLLLQLRIFPLCCEIVGDLQALLKKKSILISPSDASMWTYTRRSLCTKRQRQYKTRGSHSTQIHQIPNFGYGIFWCFREIPGPGNFWVSMQLFSWGIFLRTGGLYVKAAHIWNPHGFCWVYEQDVMFFVMYCDVFAFCPLFHGCGLHRCPTYLIWAVKIFFSGLPLLLSGVSYAAWLCCVLVIFHHASIQIKITSQSQCFV